jgi:hypothetical protein
MGWSSGSSIMREVVKAVSANVTDPEARRRIYEPIIEALDMEDWDTQDEVWGMDPACDAALLVRHPCLAEEDE